ncbi:MAG: M16 family metallopeptidase [Breznakibacter sp.]
MIKTIKSIALMLMVLVLFSCTPSKYKYESVPGDPMQSRIYTLPNGLKVYMTVNKEKPRIQTYIAVKVGGKNDPAETTGLAHYFEHLMFKGTKQFGTQNYELEKPLLDEIEAQFEKYRNTTDEAERKAIYAVIDSLSYEASKLAIPNEYDKLMSAIGAEGTNAYTSNDQTVYVENIPSNQIENWAKIQADRFENSTIRGFHTELETVYEEKNMSLTRDSRKVIENLFSALFQNHPYGTQTVLGTQEHLKNPSITNIKNYHQTWYVPNNMAICLSGDFDPDQMIATIDKYFGAMKPNENLPKLNFKPEAPMTEPVVKEVLGLESPSITIGWRLPGAANENVELVTLLSQVLYNGKAGLLDLNINQQQKLLSCYGYFYPLADHSILLIQAKPKEGQTLEQVKEIIMGEITKLKSGDFDESLLTATINNFKRYQMELLEENDGRADMFVSSFINGTNWSDEVNTLDKMSKITKEQIVAFANENLGNGYAEIHKLQGKDPNELKIEKPKITPIVTNRDTASVFLRDIQASVVTPIEPVFVDFNKDMEQFKAKSDISVLYKQNTLNGLFRLQYIFEKGTNDDKHIGTAASYLSYLGTDKLSAEEIKQAFYRLACDFSIRSSQDKTYLTISGLSENMGEAMDLFESLLAEAVANPTVLANLKADIIKSRANAKLQQNANFSMLRQYMIYGSDNPSKNILSNQEIMSLTDEELLAKAKELTSFEHKVLYYGPKTKDELLADLEAKHRVPEKLTPLAESKRYPMAVTNESVVYIAPYDAKQIYMASYSNRGEKFDATQTPIINMYNEYFGGGMNSIVFQEMREARGLAYSAGAYIMEPRRLHEDYAFATFIATQNDKMMDAVSAFDMIINDMPASENAFKLAKEGIISRLRTNRITKSDILYTYLGAQELNLDYDINKDIFAKVPTFTLEDVKAFQENRIKNRTYCYAILGDESQLDMKAMSEKGKIIRLTTEDIFGY